MKKNYVDIIIPVYNSEKFLQTCLKSIENQTYSKIRLIIVDDYSTDKSRKIIQEYKSISKYDVKVIFNKSNSGVSFSRNEALKEIESEFVSFVDSDDLLMPNHVDVLVKLIKKYNTRIAVTGGGSHLKFNPKNLKRTKKYSFEKGFKEILGASGIEGYLWNKIFYAQDIISNDLKFNNDIFMGEDLLFICNLYSYSKKGLVYSPKITYYYRPNSDSAMRKELSVSDILKKGYNWLKTYRLIKDVLDNCKFEINDELYKILSLQICLTKNELMYNLFLNNDVNNANHFKNDYYKFNEIFLKQLLFSNSFSARRKINIFKINYNNKNYLKEKDE